MERKNNLAVAYEQQSPVCSIKSEQSLNFDRINNSSFIYRSQFMYRIIKRVFDIFLSSIALVILVPIFIIVPIIIKLDSSGPAFYRQQRIGKNGRPFYIYKFRSMCTDADALLQRLTSEQSIEYESNYKLKNDFRVTKVGSFLRKINIDELPQLINIFAGQLSFVGPRPVIEKETYKYGKQRDLFLSVMPGLTGHWQVHRRLDTTYEQRIEMELHYIRNRTFKVDIRLMFETIAVLF